MEILKGSGSGHLSVSLVEQEVFASFACAGLYRSRSAPGAFGLTIGKSDLRLGVEYLFPRSR